MHITRIELEDIKSHAQFSHEFERGTTAIVGQNGAGKTTIIEAVAWTLFDLLDYKKEDFLRRGAKKGSARVTFESSVDERRYQVYRDTGTGYYVYDPELKMRIADKKEEVSRFLWQHLGVEPGTDLEVLFRTAIGVPQGTFTAVFLDTQTARKKAFDKLLKVDEYRFGADKLRETSRFVELKIVAARERIARAEGELSRYESVSTELNSLAGQVTRLSDAVREIGAETENRKASVSKLDETEARVSKLKAEFDAGENTRLRAELIFGQRDLELKASLVAAAIVENMKADHQLHVESLNRLRGLDQQRAERDKLRQSIAKSEAARTNAAAEKIRIAEDLERVEKARRTIAAIEPDLRKYEEFDRERVRLRSEIARFEQSAVESKRLSGKVAELRQKYVSIQAEIKADERLAAVGEKLPEFERNAASLTNELATSKARLESDRRFQKEIRNGLCPILSARCLNLENGMTLEAFVATQFDQTEAEIKRLEAELAANSKQIAEAREAQKISSRIAVKSVQLQQLAEEGKVLAEEEKRRIAETESLTGLRTSLTDVETAISALRDPKAQLIAAEAEIAREKGLRDRMTSIESELVRIDSEHRSGIEAIERFGELDAELASVAADRDRTEAAHRQFIVNEPLALLVTEREAQVTAVRSEIESLSIEQKRLAGELDSAAKDYDRDRHQTERTALFEAEKRLAEARANLENAQLRAAQLETELEKLKSVRDEMQIEIAAKGRDEKIFEASEFIRATLKKSAPLVARNYVYHVSLEAAQMFREITGNPERNLRWTDDYSIVLEEAGYERPFAVLSGGEQMAAALSVRLALLKQLSDIRLAFFDEPTTNMDAVRRERLAEQISLISQRKTFDQLFVISHDDTFENFADSVVAIGED